MADRFSYLRYNLDIGQSTARSQFLWIERKDIFLSQCLHMSGLGSRRIHVEFSWTVHLKAIPGHCKFTLRGHCTCAVSYHVEFWDQENDL